MMSMRAITSRHTLFTPTEGLQTQKFKRFANMTHHAAILSISTTYMLLTGWQFQVIIQMLALNLARALFWKLDCDFTVLVLQLHF